jgi:hypothetical protein
MQTAFTTSYPLLASYNNLEAFDYCIVCLFFVDLLLNFNTGTAPLHPSFLVTVSASH